MKTYLIEMLAVALDCDCNCVSKETQPLLCPVAEQSFNFASCSVYAGNSSESE